MLAFCPPPSIVPNAAAEVGVNKMELERTSDANSPGPSLPLIESPLGGRRADPASADLAYH